MIVPPCYDESAHAYEGDGPAGELEPPPYSPPPYEDDEEYDVYYYCPTVSPFLIPATKPAEDKLAALLLHLKTTTTKEREENLPPQPSTSSQPSPTDTRNAGLDGVQDPSRQLALPLSFKDIVDSNETFTAHSVGGMDEVGYSRLFRAGLAAEPHHLDRQPDTLRAKIQQLFSRSSKVLTPDSR